MKKSLLAIAIAAAVPAVASAQVTVGGIMDGGFNSVTTKQGAETTVNQTGGNAAGALASNRLFFRGTEKIGDMTAGFHYELGMDAGGTGDLSTTGGVRRSVVSLAGGFGTVEIGRDYTPIFSLSCSLDTSMCDNVNIGKSVYLAGSGTDGIRVTTVRNSGQIMYTTPTMGGLVARVAVTNRSNDTKVNGDVESTGGSLVYSAGPLMVGAAVGGVAIHPSGKRVSNVWESTHWRGICTGNGKQYLVSSREESSNAPMDEPISDCSWWGNSPPSNGL